MQWFQGTPEMIVAALITMWYVREMPQPTPAAVVIKQLFDAKTFSEITRFVNEFIPLIPLASDALDPDNASKFKRKYAHNLPFFVDIHHQLAGYASEIFGKKVKPSYSFLSLYEKGGQCPLHIDRPQCRYTIDYLIQQEDKEPWEIKIGHEMTDAERDAIKVSFPQKKSDVDSVISSTQWFSALLKPNDAVCYSGTNSWHYRPHKSKGKADLVFWHFVPEDFNGPLA